MPIDWNENTPVQAKPLLCVPPAGEHMSLSYVFLPQDIVLQTQDLRVD